MFKLTIIHFLVLAASVVYVEVDSTCTCPPLPIVGVGDAGADGTDGVEGCPDGCPGGIGGDGGDDDDAAGN